MCSRLRKAICLVCNQLKFYMVENTCIGRIYVYYGIVNSDNEIVTYITKVNTTQS